ncbi:uncharacterized protein N7477_005815 [Penicillium maclennaniae]|uniref:uncharacterized protein n=1 Tax=Penicillium maclennaniae TaxID=1343394 RepID=UPI002542535F|nr:uncharacterized protein N7477_005815 [Penicillium maclennaniae]KAJ5670452.1 hypothetical protein N7477_005815 [Penicillium maclennaniae]
MRVVMITSNDILKLASQTIGKFSVGMDFEYFTSSHAPLHPIVTNITNLHSLKKKITAHRERYRNLPFGDPATLKKVQRIIDGCFEFNLTLLETKILL